MESHPQQPQAGMLLEHMCGLFPFRPSPLVYSCILLLEAAVIQGAEDCEDRFQDRDVGAVLLEWRCRPLPTKDCDVLS